MKNLVAFILVLFSFNISYSQSLGVKVGLLNVNNFSNNGFGVTIEYDKPLSDNFQLTYLSSILLNSENTSIGDLDYLQIPVNIGVKYYLFSSTIDPYVSLEGGVSYFSYDLLETKFIDQNNPPQGTKTEINSYNKIVLGVGVSVGSIIKLSDKIDFDINAKYYLGSNAYSHYLIANAGIKFGL